MTVTALDDSWQEDLVQLLKDEFEAESVEERVVGASLRAVPVTMRAGVNGLFTLFGVFGLEFRFIS